MKTILLTHILVITSQLFVFAQQPPNPIMYTSSPTAAELGSYGRTPVGLFTGTAQVNIPLYELKTKNLSLPISLNYSSNGFVVNKIASNVGFDWSLFAGGVITRNVNGYPDNDHIHGYSGFPVDPNKPKINWTQQEKDAVTSYFAGGNWNEGIDTEPDLFSYNFAGYSGMFYMQPSKSNFPANVQIASIPYQNDLKFNGTPDVDFFSITDSKGIIYEFIPGDIILNSLGAPYGIHSVSYALSKITHPSGEQILFYYSKTLAFNYYVGISQNASSVVRVGGNGNQDCPWTLPNGEIAQQIRNITFVLDSIVATGYGKVVIEHDNSRSDTPDFRIKSLTVFDTNGNKIKSIELAHEFPQTSEGLNYNYLGGDVNSLKYRMFLDAVVIKDKDDNLVQYYSMDYNNLNGLPIRNSYNQDHWGFYNGASNTNLLPTGQIPQNSYLSPSVAGANRNPNSLYSQRGMLNKITYPTGGYTTFEYEPHKDDLNQEFGGVRLSLQKDYTNVGSVPLIRKYMYSGGVASARENNNPSYYLQFAANVFCSVVDLGFFSEVFTTYNAYWLRSNSGVPFNMCAKATVGYNYVNIYYDENNQYGREEHSFSMSGDDIGSNLFGQLPSANPPITNFGWKSGTEKSVKYFDNSSNLIKEIIFNYIEDQRKDITNYFVKVEGLIPKPDAFAWGFNTIDNFFTVNNYAILSKWQHLESKIEIDYSPGALAPLVKQEQFTYADHGKLRQKTLVNSNNKTLTENYYYPEDYGAGVSNYATLTLKNIIASPIDQRTYNDGKLISGNQVKYNDIGQPTDVYIADINPSTPTDIQFDLNNPYTFTHRTTYQYDLSNNTLLSSQNDSDVATIFIWDKAGTLPIAKVVNAKQMIVPEQTSATVSIYNGAIPNTTVTCGAMSGFTLNIPQTVTFTGSISRSNSYYSVFQVMLKKQGTTVYTFYLLSVNGSFNYTSIQLAAGSYTVCYAFESDPGETPNVILANFQTANILSPVKIRQVIFCTSFEEDGTVDPNPKTGNKVRNGLFSVVMPPAVGNYILSYFQRPLAGGTWSYVETPLNVVATNSPDVVIGALDKAIDEVRLYPANAQITTFTHKQLIGITSSTDTNGITTYYDYDSFGRLQLIKDDNKSLLKKLEYFYKLF